MATIAAPVERMKAAWEQIAARFTAYELLLPGSVSFVCQAEQCVAHCCKVFSVALGDEERARMERWSRLTPSRFLESEHGEPITLPLAQPYLLARRHGACALLGDDLRCAQYEGRPNACRLYPHFILLFDEATGRPTQLPGPEALAAVERGLADGGGAVVPLLARHLECPGFTGPPLAEGEWEALLRETAALQFEFL